jgi:signal transduction histidine kinase
VTVSHLRFSVDILRRLGEELNPHLGQGVLELVKNAYDADARNCSIELSNVYKAGGEVTITDDGIGMDEGGILNGWLMLGQSKKADGRVTGLGRRPVGNKGLGRLAALRMGHVASLRTVPAEAADKGFSIDIDWQAFTNAVIVEEVPLTIEPFTPEAESSHGTVVTLRQLRAPVTRSEVKRLARDLILLADPFTNLAGFKPNLIAPEYKDLERLVAERYFDQAEFHLKAELDEAGKASASVADYRGNVLFVADHEELSSGNDHPPYGAPRAQLDLWVFILDAQTFSSRTIALKDVRSWLAEFGGVHLYERDIRVLPYGSPGHDWLNLNLRRAQSPELRPSTNTSIGRVAILGESDQLLQKTDRGGFVENAPFEELKRFATDALEWMARRRLEQRNEERRQQRASASQQARKSSDAVSAAVAGLPQEHRGALQRVFDEYRRTQEKETRALREEIQLYRTLCTAGIAAGVFAHEANKGLVNIGRKARSLEKAVKEKLGHRFTGDLEEAFQLLIGAASSVRAFGNVTLGLLEHEKRRRARISLNTTVRNTVKLFKSHLERRRVEVDIALDVEDAFLFTSEAALESILVNLLTNSLEALRKAPAKERRVRIETQSVDSRVRLRFLDNGAGIDGISLKDMWLPGQSTTSGGAGLGLTIVRDSVADLGGRVEALPRGEMGGAEFVVDLPRLLD